METDDEAARIMGMVSDYGHGRFVREDGLCAIRWSQILDAVTRLVAERDAAVRETQVIKDELLEWGPVEGEL